MLQENYPGISVHEADLGMFSMFGRTGAPTKAQFFSYFLQHGNKPEILK